uniref:Multidrug and toxin extrusion protein n=1 Tax=Globisporangium ultimum (strain ATCC 200006 / CBS 805.95 / DAOM BR144) TaxID=431595 RepID=K3WE55_GLOUD
MAMRHPQGSVAVAAPRDDDMGDCKAKHAHPNVQCVAKILDALLFTRHRGGPKTHAKVAQTWYPPARAGVEPLDRTGAATRASLPTGSRKSTEYTPLLLPNGSKRPPLGAYDGGATRTDTETIFGLSTQLLKGEASFLFPLAIQMLLSNVIDFLPGFISGVLTGHLSHTLSAEYIAAKSLAGIFMMITGYTVNIAIGAAMDTLCAQAYGAGKLHEMGIFFQTGILLFALCFVPVTVISYFCVDILVLLGQRSDIAVLARNLVLFMLPSLPFHIVNALLCKILQGQNIIKPMVYAGIVGNVVHGVLIYVLMFHTAVGYVGSSIASSALIACYTITLCVYFFQSHLYHKEWPGWRLGDALRMTPEFVRLGVSGLLMFIFEYWGFAAVSLFSGLLPNPDASISADSTYSSFRVLCALFYGTISVAGSVRVGNALGANDPERAKAAAYLSIALTVLCSVVTTFVMLWLRNVYPFAYTSDPKVVALTSNLMLLTCPFQIFAGISAAVQGIFRGSGLQLLGARLNFVCYLVLAMPIGITLAYQCKLGLTGLWLGLCAGFMFSGIYCLYWLQRANWHEMASAAQKRTREPCEQSPDVGVCLC